MPYLCEYDNCGHREKEIPEGDAVVCFKCNKKFHKDCFEKHNNEKHKGAAQSKKLEEPKCD